MWYEAKEQTGLLSIFEEGGIQQWTEASDPTHLGKEQNWKLL